MANLNLSEFGEKLFVTDADHTFIWDTVGAISKRVSRNSWLNSGTLTSDAPVTISQTWNAGSNVMTALKVVATDTASGTTSNLLELWAGSTPALKFSLGKDGQLNLKKLGTSVDASVVSYDSGGLKSGFYFPNSGLDLAWTRANGAVWGVGFNRCSVNSSARFSWSSSNDPLGTEDTILLRDGAANTLALRNGAAAQTFNVYGTYTSITDYKRLSISCSATTGNATIGVPFNSVLAVTGGSSPSTTATITFATQAAAFPVGSSVVIAGVTPSGYNGTYVVTASTTSSVSYTVGGALAAWSSGGTATVSGVASWILQSGGHLLAGADNQYDIGASGANRPRNVYVGNSVTTGSIAPNSGADLIFNGASTGAAWKITPSGHFHAFADNAYDIGASGANRPRNVYVGSNVISRPAASITPANNGEFVVEATSNTTLTFKLKGTDGTVRSGTITLA